MKIFFHRTFEILNIFVPNESRFLSLLLELQSLKFDEQMRNHIKFVYVQKCHIFNEIEVLFQHTKSILSIFSMLLTSLSAQIESRTTMEAEEQSSNTLAKGQTALHIWASSLPVNIR